MGPVGLALTVVELLAIGIAPSQTRDRYRLASQGISRLLDMEESALQGSPGGSSGGSQSDPANEPRQPRQGAPHIHGELLKLEIPVSSP